MVLQREFCPLRLAPKQSRIDAEVTARRTHLLGREMSIDRDQVIRCVMSDKLFPEARSVEILGELSAWTSVADVMVAAHILEARTVPGDQPESMLLMTLEHADLEFEQIFAILLGYLMNGYVVPSAKVAVCRVLDPQITEETGTALKSLRFRPTVQVGRVPRMRDKRAFFIHDKPVTHRTTPLNAFMSL